MLFYYLFKHFVLYQDCKEDDDKLIFVFSSAVIHLNVEHIWNVFHTGKRSKQNVNGKVRIVSPLVNINERKYLPTVVDNTCKKQLLYVPVYLHKPSQIFFINYR